MVRFIVIIIVFLSILCGCENDSDLGEGYYYLPDYESYDVGYPYGSIIYRSNKEFDFDEVLICSDILKVNHDNDFIIVMQKPNKELIDRYLDDLIFFELGNNNNDSIVELMNNDINIKEIVSFLKTNSINKSYNIKLDSFYLKNDSYKKFFKNDINYYLIKKNNNDVIGPLNKVEFENLRKQERVGLFF